jgi:hypothetical protein
VRVEAGVESFTQVVAGSSHTCALTSAGSAYCWGANSEGQLGDGTRLVRFTPVAVDQPAAFVSLTAGTRTPVGSPVVASRTAGAAISTGSSRRNDRRAARA